MVQPELIYRVIFTQNGKPCELHARYICEESLMGFVEVEDLVFSESTSKLVVDTNEERLKQEFKGVKRTYIPLHAVSRIDEVKYQDCYRMSGDENSFSGSVSYIAPTTPMAKQSDNESGRDF